MQRRTQLLIGLTVVALGVGVVALGALESESTVRYVEDVLDTPQAHERGTYTLLGVPQPAELPAPGGTTQPNPDYANQTVTLVPWTTQDGRRVVSTHTVTVEIRDGGSHWHLQNVTHELGRPEPIAPAVEHSWTVTGPHLVVRIQNFAYGETPARHIWGVFEGSLRDPIQPKPSQFEGRVSLEHGTPVYVVDEYTAGCSSKFLPPEAIEAEQAAAEAGEADATEAA
ncbi:MAG: hypothetical protein ACPGQL_05695 [Thermoplasmatota archaeon]